MEYKATLDLTSKIITTAITILFSGIALWNFKLMAIEPGVINYMGVNIFSTTLILAIYAFCYSFRPTGYSVEKNTITIKRPFKNYSIDLNKVKNVFLTSKESMKWTIRTFGNGGLFGYFGKFRNQAFGNMTWYATRRSNYMILETTDNRKIVLTPDDTAMIKEIEKHLSNQTHSTSKEINFKTF